MFEACSVRPDPLTVLYAQVHRPLSFFLRTWHDVCMFGTINETPDGREAVLTVQSSDPAYIEQVREMAKLLDKFGNHDAAHNLNNDANEEMKKKRGGR